MSFKEKLKSSKEIERLYEKGKTVYSENRKLKSIYLIDSRQKITRPKVAISVAKKTGTAVWRNKLKRLLRESYRLNKQKVIEKCEERKVLLEIILASNSINEKRSKKIFLSDIQPEVIDILGKVSSAL